jgi:putative spermidine/putrescine transport system substrate-binding protein
MLSLAGVASSPLQLMAGATKAMAAQEITAVTWGGPLLKANEVIAAAFTSKTGTNVLWELHEGASANILSKIKATWPDSVKYDIVQAVDAVLLPMMKEGWLEDVDDVQGLNEIAKALVDRFRDADGKAKVVPVATDGSYFGYRTDMINVPIKSVKDLLDPGLKGKIGLLDPIMYQFMPYIAMALELGGDEKNLEPAWEFMKQLAASGNVAQVLKSDVDTINALTTGAVGLSFTGIGNWGNIDKAVPTTHCNRVDGSKGLKSFLYTLGWGILKSPRATEAKEFASYLIRADLNQAYAAATFAGPANVNAKTSPELEKFVLSSEDDIKKYAYFPDFDYISQNIGEWSKRFEVEIQPLLRQG